MPQCALLKKKPQYDFKKEYLEASLGQGVEGEMKRSEGGDGPASLTVGSIKSTTDPCVEDIFQKDDLKKMFSKWNKLKRVRDMYDEQVSMKRADCFRYKILKHMKKKIVEMPPEQRRTWLTKLIKLAFMNRLKEIKDLKVKRKTALMDRLESARGEERDFLLRQLTQLKDIYDIKELDDVNQIIELKEAKKNDKLKKSKEIGMKIRLNRLKKLEEIKLNEEKRLREERVDKLKEIVSVKKHWQEDMIKKIDNVTKNLVEGLVHLKDKEEWYNKLKLEMEEEKTKLIEDENERLEQERIASTIQKDWEMAKKKREQKLKEIETWHKERKVRLWKLDRVKKFEEFLENRYKMAEANENLFFKKIFKKLSASEKRKVPVNPWAMKPVLEDRQKEIAKRKKYNSWVNSIISSNKSKVVKNVKLKKYLEVMETPHFDKMFEAAKKIDSVQHIMTIIRGRIFKSTFPERTKQYIAKQFNLMVTKAKLDVRDLDPTDKLHNIQLTTNHYELYLTAGDEYVIMAQQKVSPPVEPCQDRTDVLCISKDERDKMLEIINKRQESRKVIKERRLEEYEAYQNRMALDDAWAAYMKKAYDEALKDLHSCKKVDDDMVKLEVVSERRDLVPPKEIKQDERPEKDSWAVIPGLTDMQLKALVTSGRPTAAANKQEAKKLDYNEAMDKRVDRLNSLVKDMKDDGSTPYYIRQKTNIRDLLEKEKAVRAHMIKNLPEEEEE